MPKAVSKAERKQKYFAKLIKLLDEYSKILLVTCDNVGSNHMQKIRQSVRGEAVILMGKNVSYFLLFFIIFFIRFRKCMKLFA